MVKADMIIRGNRIFTGKKMMEGGIAIKDGKIIEVCKEDSMAQYIGNETQVYKFDNQTIMPGFHDFHIHLTLGCLFEDYVNLADARSAEETAQKVKDFADSRPDDEWILGFSWYHIFWDKKDMPDRTILDELIPDRPVFLLNAECHGAWLNSKALKLAGIDENTENPPFGMIMKDEDGKPTGILLETAMRLAADQAFKIPEKKAVELMERFLAKANRLGITSVSDMLPLPGFEVGDLSLYRKFEQDDKLTVRTFFLSPLNGDLSQARGLREEYQSDVLRFSGLKQFLDGVATTYTALMVEPYSDNPSEKGEAFLPPGLLEQWITEADREGFRVRLHACGDGAVRLGLDLYEKAEEQNRRRDSRHTIEHIEVIHPDDIRRFQQLGVVASMQPEHMAITEKYQDNVYLTRMGQERDQYTWPIKTLGESGAAMAFGSDFPVVELNPMLEIYRAVTRRFNDGEPEDGWNPKEKIPLEEALRHYTAGPAFGNFMEDKLGTLEKGKLADVIVMDRDLFAVDPEQLLEAKVKFTVMDGKVVYKDEEL
ncbi:amidohydrolase [Siminovitchia fortis]|uniref:Amidohydrolase n=1 Tax=Siminovitchia fortis TaxID=254758 RepID=A0A443ILV1_9BACI|nr:amidohydrolase [Siminovitchia fortis]RWR06121.1 amidohydrolase [Siminovitchia fortis]WHY81554.1 amidohydrolase [Siminovitchia fortis]